MNPSWAFTLLWAYIIGSLALLFAVRATRLYPLYLLKTAWVAFTVLVFAWVVMMSGADTEEFAKRPAGFFEELKNYPQRSREMFHANIWWLFALLWVPVWFAGGLYEPGTNTRRYLRIALSSLSLVLAVPLVSLAIRFDWSAYGHFTENYRHAWKIARMGDYFLNSVLVSACAVGMVTLVGALTAYALARLEFPGREWLNSAFIASMGIPGFLLVVPLFVMMKGWTAGNFSFMDSRTGLAVLYAAGSIPFTAFLLTAFFKTLPHELAEAAALDGASPWQIFTEVYFPLAAPGMATAAIFNFLGVWNEYNFALIFVTNPEFKTLPVGLYNLQVSQTYAANFPAMFAGAVLLCLPTFLIFVVLQERIVAGLTVGSVKG